MATLIFQIEVTGADLRNGQRGHCETCAVALAATRSLGQPVRVGWNRIFTDTHVGLMSDEAKHLVAAFDGRDFGDLKPLTFDIEMRPFKHAHDAIYQDAVHHD